jgi:hypothetical protein
VRGAAQSRHLGRQQLGISAIPAVGQDHHQRATAQPASMGAVEFRQGGADPSPARDIEYRGAGAVQGPVGIAAR